MKNYNIKGDWSKFKKAIYELYETLSFHFNKNSSIKMKKMGSRTTTRYCFSFRTI